MPSLRTVEDKNNKNQLDKSSYFEVIITVITAMLILVLSCYVKNLISEKVKFLSNTFYYTYTNQQGDTVTWYFE
ncbi:MAG: hypothetical protein ACTSPJ_08815, partial [Candidatus Heimdallarchaeaceae archaeon]